MAGGGGGGGGGWGVGGGGGGGGGGNAVEMLYSVNLLEPYFVNTCRYISICNGMYQLFSYECLQSN